MKAHKLNWGSLVLLATSLTFAMMTAKPAHADDMSDWKREVAKLVGKNQGYPRSAQIRKIEGSAKVKLVIEGTGAIANFELVESSSHDILDKQVTKLVQKIDPLPAPPDNQQMTLVFPLTWKLN